MGKYLNDRGRRILTALDRAAESEGASPAQIALAWLIGRPGVTAAIASATSVKQFTEIAKAATLKLDPATVALLEQASALPAPDATAD